MAAATEQLVKDFTARMEEAERLVSTLSQKLTRLEEANATLKERLAQTSAAKAGAANAAANDSASFPDAAFKAALVTELKSLREVIQAEKAATEQLQKEKEELAEANQKLKYRVKHLVRTMEEEDKARR